MVLTYASICHVLMQGATAASLIGTSEANPGPPMSGFESNVNDMVQALTVNDAEMTIALRFPVKVRVV